MFGGIGVLTHLPYSTSSEYATRQEHPDVDRRRLDDRSNCDDDAHHLHEPQTAQPICNDGLCEGSHCFAGDVDRDDLFRLEMTCLDSLFLESCISYSTGETIRRIPHVIDPALMSNRWHSLVSASQ